jgi:hypothetical protein
MAHARQSFISPFWMHPGASKSQEFALSFSSASRFAIVAGSPQWHFNGGQASGIVQVVAHQ